MRNQDEFVVPGILFVIIVVAGTMFFKWNSMASVILGLAGFGIVYYLLKKK